MTQEEEEEAPQYPDDGEDILGNVKQLKVTKNELLYLSDSVTLLIEHSSEDGRIYIPARQLMPSAGVPVPIELIQIIGMGFLSLADKSNTSNTTILSLTISDLYLLRECCQSFVKVNDEFVGYNLLVKIYDLTLDTRSRVEIMTQLLDKIMKESTDEATK